MCTPLPISSTSLPALYGDKKPQVPPPIYFTATHSASSSMFIAWITVAQTVTHTLICTDTYEIRTNIIRSPQNCTFVHFLIILLHQLYAHSPTHSLQFAAQPFPIPKELWRLVDLLWTGGALREKNLFLSTGADATEVSCVWFEGWVKEGRKERRKEGKKGGRKEGKLE